MAGHVLIVHGDKSGKVVVLLLLAEDDLSLDIMWVEALVLRLLMLMVLLVVLLAMVKVGIEVGLVGVVVAANLNDRGTGL